MQTTLLYVDDNAPLARFAAFNLRAAIPDLVVVTAASCAEARKAMDVHAPAIVLADWQLPDGCGQDLLVDLGGGGCQAVLLTSSASQHEHQTRPRGIDAVLRKPFSAEALVDLVGALCRRREPTGPRLCVEPSPPRRPSRRHTLANRLTAVVMGLHALRADLEVAGDDPPEVRRLVEEYLGRFREIGDDFRELLEGSHEQ